MKLRLLLIPSALLLAAAFLVPILLWDDTGNAWWLLLIPVFLLLLLFLALRMLLWGARGGVREVLRGRSKSEPLIWTEALHVDSAEEPFAVKIDIDLSRPVATISERYLSFGIDVSLLGWEYLREAKGDKLRRDTANLYTTGLDLHRPMLNTFARALSPAYLRIG